MSSRLGVVEAESGKLRYGEVHRAIQVASFTEAPSLWGGGRDIVSILVHVVSGLQLLGARYHFHCF